MNWWKRACAVVLLCATTAIALPAQTFTALHSFDNTDGAGPWAGLVQATNGSLYGTTLGGGASSACMGPCGTVFSLSVRLGPFVETQPTSGKVGAAVKILGTNLTGATSVSSPQAGRIIGLYAATEVMRDHAAALPI